MKKESEGYRSAGRVIPGVNGANQAGVLIQVTNSHGKLSHIFIPFETLKEVLDEAKGHWVEWLNGGKHEEKKA